MMITRNIFLFVIIMSFSQNRSFAQIDIQGHRGARGLLPENSIPSFIKAIELGATTIEMDVFISKDKKVVVSHDGYMHHKFCLQPNGEKIAKDHQNSFNLFEMNYDSIKRFDCGKIGNPDFPEQERLSVFKPLLSEVIKIAEEKSSGKIKYNIEIKSSPQMDGIYTPEIPEYVELVLNEISNFAIADRVTLQSFDLRTLEQIHKTSPQTEIALLVEGSNTIEEQLKKLSFKPEIISPHYKMLTQDSVKNYQKSGYKVIPWTVNDEKDLLRMIDWKVDGIITDFPDRLIDLL